MKALILVIFLPGLVLANVTLIERSIEDDRINSLVSIHALF